MKKIATIISCLVLSATASSAFAAVKVAAKPDVPLYGQDYIGEIVAAAYGESDEPQSILIMTKRDPRDKSNLQGLTIRITNKDLAFGNTLAASVGKKLAITFKNADYEISSVNIVTDEYWFGNNNRK